MENLNKLKKWLLLTVFICAVLSSFAQGTACNVIVNNASICIGSGAKLTATGGTTYSWSTGQTCNPIIVYPTVTTTYSVTATSTCHSESAIATVTVKPVPIISVNSQKICNGSSATLTATGGTTYSWSTGQTINPITVSPTITTIYKVTGTKDGCTGTALAIVTVNSNPKITLNSQTICIGNSATLTASGGTTYSWSTGQTINPITVSPTISTLYKVTGTTDGCTGTAVTAVNVNSNPVVYVANQTICYGTSATLTATGATSYSWTTGQTINPITVFPTITTTYTVTGTTYGCTGTAISIVKVIANPIVSVNNPTMCFGTSATLTAQGADSYIWCTCETINPITVSPSATRTYKVTGTTDGCSGTAYATVTVISNPIITVNSPSICKGGSAILTASGGNTYSWSTGETINPITVSPSITTTYKVTGAIESCSGTAMATVTVNSYPNVNVNSPTICKGTSATLTATGGTTYSWSTGQTINPIIVSPTVTTTYSVTGTNSGCTGTALSIVTVNSNPIVSVNNSTMCKGTSATLTATGASSYSWSTCQTINPITVSPTVTTTYKVTGTTEGCSGSAMATVTVNQNPTITVNNPTICNGSSATLTANGGNFYSWTTGETTNPIIVSPTITTTYKVTGTTESRCFGTAMATVTVILNPGINVNSPTICSGSSATLTATGSTAYSWTTGQTINPITVSPTVTTTYSVTGTTAGCTGTALATVYVTRSPVISVNSPSICNGTSTTLTATGGITYSWSTGQTINPIIVSPTVTTTYRVTGSASGCTGTAIAIVTVFSNPTITVNSPSICYRSSATLTASGGTSYSWSTGETTNPIIVTPAGTTTYMVTGTVSGCSGTAMSTVTVNPYPEIYVKSPTICSGTSTTLTATGGTTYLWSTGQTINPIIVSPTITTTYKVTGTTSGCTGTNFAIVTVIPNPVISVNRPTICKGISATLTATGGTTYSWSTGQTINPIVVTPNYTTVYLVTGTTEGCTGSALAIVTIAPNLSITVNSPTICNGSSATLTATGGTTYSWSTGQPNNPIVVTPTVTTTYIVTGTTDGCTGTAVSTVTYNPNPTPKITLNQGVICNGSSAILIANGGDTYSWTTGETTNPITVTPSITTTYKVTGTTTAGCTGTAFTAVTVYPVPTVTVNSPTICQGFSATLSATGGTTYSWTTGQKINNITVSPTVTTTYSVTGTNSGCTGTAIATVTVNTNPKIIVNNPVICTGNSATLIANGNNSYSWSTGETTNSIIVTPSITTTYKVTGTTDGCTGTALSTVKVNTYPLISVNSPSVCSGSSATLTANGGDSYSWSTGEIINPLIAFPTSTTTYKVTGTKGGCTGTALAKVTVIPIPPVSIDDQTICAGTTTTLTANGGDSYSWSTSEQFNTITCQPAYTSTYQVTATAQNGCSGNTIVRITVIPNPIINVNNETICKGSSATLIAIGGTTYSWSTGQTINSITVTPTITTTYKVTGTTNGCSGSAMATVTVNTVPMVYVNNPIMCRGTSATLTATGAGTYSWSSGQTINPVIVSPTVTTTYSVTGTTAGCTGTVLATVTVNANPVVSVNSPAVCKGNWTALTAIGATTYSWTTSQTVNPIYVSPTITTTYTVTGTTSGCTGTAMATVTVNTIPVVSVNSPTICNGTSATLTAIGATTYLWSTGYMINPLTVMPTVTTTYSVTGTTEGCTGTAMATVTVNRVPVVTINNPTICSGTAASLLATGAGAYSWTTGQMINPITVSPTVTTTYTVTGTTEGCTGTAMATVTVNPTPIVIVNNETICKGSSATLTATGGTTYSWSTYQTINPITVSPINTTTYKVTGTTKGCNGTAIATVTVNPIPIISVNRPTICSGTSVTLTANGGTTYSWSTGETISSIIVAPTSTSTYSVTGSTAGCDGTTNAIVVVNQIPVVTVNNPTLCNISSAFLTATGGTTYSWSTGQTINPIMVSPAITTTYSVTGTSAGCTATAIATVTVGPILSIAVNSPTICKGNSAILTATGGTTYSWSTGQTFNPISVAPSTTTTYKVTVSEAGCTGSAMSTVTVNLYPTIAVNSPTICSGTTATLTATGGTTYSWSTGETINPIIVFPTNTSTYSVTGTTGGCAGTAIATVTVNPIPQVSVDDQTICAGSSATLIAIGGNSYSWSTGERISTIICYPSITSTYVVTATSNGCTGSTSATITVIPKPAISVNSAVICKGASATLTATGGTIYSWTTGQTINPIIVSPAITTTYKVTGTTNGCIGTALTTVTVKPLQIPVISGPPSICSGSAYVYYTQAGMTNYIWSVSGNGLIIGGGTLTDYNISVKWNKPGPETISVKYQNPLGCIADTTVIYNVYVEKDDLNDGLIAYFPFNGNCKDMSGHGNHACVFGAIPTRDRFGNENCAYSFNGKDNYMKILQSPSLRNLTTATFSYWIKYHSPDGVIGSTICNGPDKNDYDEDGFYTYACSNGIHHNLGRWGGKIRTAWVGCDARQPIDCQSFILITIVIDSNNIRSYKNGILQQVTPRMGLKISRPDLDWYFGGCGAKSYFLNGILDDIRIYNRAITDCEIAHIYRENRCEIVINHSNTNNICHNKPNQLTACGSKNFKWNTGETTPSILVAPTCVTTYSVTGTNGACTATSSLTIYPETSDPEHGLALSLPIDGWVTDVSGNNNQVVAYGGVEYVPNRFGKPKSAIKFDGSTGYIRIAQSPSLNNLTNASFTFWVKYGLNPGQVATTITNGPDNVSERGFYSYAFNNYMSFTLGKFYDPSNVTAKIPYNGTATPDQKFSFVTVVIDDDSVRTYLDALPMDAVARKGMPISRPSQDWLIGQSGSNTMFLNGTIDDVRIYNRALNNCEIADIYNYNDCGITTLNGLSVAVCNGNGATLVATGGATYSWSTGKVGAVQTVYPTATTNYLVTIYQSSGCFAIQNYRVDVVNCVKDETNNTESINNISSNNNNIYLSNSKLSFSIYPNPFNDISNITFSIPTNQKVELNVYNLLGNKVVVLIDEQKDAGSYTTQFNKNKLIPGIYFIEMKAGDTTLQKRVVVL